MNVWMNEYPTSAGWDPFYTHVLSSNEFLSYIAQIAVKCTLRFGFTGQVYDKAGGQQVSPWTATKAAGLRLPASTTVGPVGTCTILTDQGIRPRSCCLIYLQQKKCQCPTQHPAPQKRWQALEVQYGPTGACHPLGVCRMLWPSVWLRPRCDWSASKRLHRQQHVYASRTLNDEPSLVHERKTNPVRRSGELIEVSKTKKKRRIKPGKSYYCARGSLKKKN